jgi:hypothetical protein
MAGSSRTVDNMVAFSSSRKLEDRLNVEMAKALVLKLSCGFCVMLLAHRVHQESRKRQHYCLGRDWVQLEYPLAMLGEDVTEW